MTVILDIHLHLGKGSGITSHTFPYISFPCDPLIRIASFLFEVHVYAVLWSGSQMLFLMNKKVISVEGVTNGFVNE